MMKRLLEKISLLGLSFMLISSFSISSALPQMKEFFSQYSSSQVELLVSMPSFFVMATLLCNRWITRWLTERHTIILGLGLVTVMGVFPFFVHDYWWILVSRMFFGVGTGLINALAIAIISEHYSGREKVQMLGYRGSAEVVGGAFLTFLVGLLIRVDWYWAFLAYGFGLVVLALYLFFAPQEKPHRPEASPTPAKEHLTSQQILLSLGMAVVAAWVICINSSISLRVPDVVVAAGFGSGTDASRVLSLQQLIGIAAGMSFAPLLHHLKHRLLVVATLGLSLSLIGMAYSPNIWVLGIFSIASGFFYSVSLTTLFHSLSERIPLSLLNAATALVLIGCNLGSAISPYSLQLMGAFGITGLSSFLTFGVLSLGMVVILWWMTMTSKKSQ